MGNCVQKQQFKQTDQITNNKQQNFLSSQSKYIQNHEKKQQFNDKQNNHDNSDHHQKQNFFKSKENIGRYQNINSQVSNDNASGLRGSTQNGIIQGFSMNIDNKENVFDSHNDPKKHVISRFKPNIKQSQTANNKNLNSLASSQSTYMDPSLLKVQLTHNNSLMGDQDAIQDQDGKYFYPQLPQNQLGYIKRKYLKIIGSLQQTMNKNQFIRFFSHLQYSQSSYQKLFQQFLKYKENSNSSNSSSNSNCNTLTYEQLKNAVAQFTNKSAIQIQKFLYKSYFLTQYDYLNFIRESISYVQNKKVKTIRSLNQEKQISQRFAQLQHFVKEKSQRQIKIWLKEYINFNNFRKIFIEKAIKKSELKIRQKLALYDQLKINFQKEKRVYIISNKWVGKLQRYLKNKYGQYKNKKGNKIQGRCSLNITNATKFSSQPSSNLKQKSDQKSGLFSPDSKKLKKSKQYPTINYQTKLTTSFLKKMKQKAQLLQIQQLKTDNYFPGQIDNSSLTGNFQWQLKSVLDKDIDYKIVPKDIYNQLLLLFGQNQNGKYKYQRKYQNGKLQLYPIFIKTYQFAIDRSYDKNNDSLPFHFVQKSLLTLQPQQKLDQIFKLLPNDSNIIHYQRKLGKKWKILSKNDIGKVGQYFSNTCFIVSINKKLPKAIQSFQAKYIFINQKDSMIHFLPTVGDIYALKTFSDKQIQDQSCKLYKVYISKVTKQNISYVHPDFKYFLQKTTSLEQFQKTFKKVVIHGISTIKTLNNTNQKRIVRGGLQNMGNTCYLNATVQMLIHIRTQNLFLSQKAFGKQFKFISQQLQKQKSSLLPVSFKKTVDKNLDYFKGNDQHDAHQFLVNILEKLQIQNKIDFQQNFLNTITRKLNCKKCDKHWQRKDTTPVISLPIKNYDRKQFKIIYDQSNKVRTVKFQMSSSGTVLEWKQSFFEAINQTLNRQNHDNKFLFAQVNSSSIIRQFNSLQNEQKPFKSLNIRNNDLIIAYQLQQIKVDKEDAQLKCNYYYYYHQGKMSRNKNKIFIAREISKANGFIDIQIKQKPSGKLVKRRLQQWDSRSHLQPYYHDILNQSNDSTIMREQPKKAIIKLINRNLEFDQIISYPQVFYVRIDQPIKVLRLQLQRLFGKGNFQLKIVGISQTKLCYFCKQRIVLKSAKNIKSTKSFVKNNQIYQPCNCFIKNQQLYPIQWFNQEVQYVILWKKADHYKKCHIKQPDIQPSSIIDKYKTTLKQSMNMFSKKQIIQMTCEYCNTKNASVQSWQEIKTPSNNILIIHLKRFAFDSKQTKIYTKWNLQRKINFCGNFYELKGVILHIGDGSAGHYIAVADEVKYDDQWVDNYSYDKISTGQIYILFYKRIFI